MNRRMLVGPVAMIAIVLAGCGSSGPSLSAFKSAFQKDKVQFTQLGRDLQSAIRSASGSSNTTIATEFSSLSSRATQQANQLRKLNPPSKYKSQTQQLASAFDSVAADLSQIANAANSNSGSAARTATMKLLQDAASLRSVDRSLTASLGLPQTSQ